MSFIPILIILIISSIMALGAASAPTKSNSAHSINDKDAFKFTPFAFPAGVEESGLFAVDQMDPFLLYAPVSCGVRDDNIRATCKAILRNKVKYASLHLNTEILRYGIPSRGNVENYDAGQLIAEMVASNRCQLEYLDLSNSSLRASELIQILDSLPSNHTLKCIYIGFNDWSKDNLLELAIFLRSKNPGVLILGLHNLLIYDQTNLSWNEFSLINSEITEALDDYNLSIAPQIDLNAHLETDNVRFSEYGERISGSSLYH